jgi:hypothetical protein
LRLGAKRGESFMPRFALEGETVTGVKLASPGGNTVNEDLTRYLYQLPTLAVKRVSSDPQTKNISFVGSIQCVNFLSPCVAILQTATMVNNGWYFFFQTGGIGVLTLQLDNSGLINGVSVYPFSGPVQFQFIGGNLV